MSYRHCVSIPESGKPETAPNELFDLPDLTCNARPIHLLRQGAVTPGSDGTVTQEYSHPEIEVSDESALLPQATLAARGGMILSLIAWLAKKG